MYSLICIVKHYKYFYAHISEEYNFVSERQTVFIFAVIDEETLLKHLISLSVVHVTVFSQVSVVRSSNWKSRGKTHSCIIHI